jgi:hypothetical protein
MLPSSADDCTIIKPAPHPSLLPTEKEPEGWRTRGMFVKLARTMGNIVLTWNSGMKKRKYLYILILLLLSPVMYCVLVIIFGHPMYWVQPPHREKPVKLEDLLIKTEDLSGQWVLQDNSFSDDHYSWEKFHEENLGYSMNNIQATEFVHNRIIRNWNIPVAEFRYDKLYKDKSALAGLENDNSVDITVNNIQKMGDRTDVICKEPNGISCLILMRIDEYVVVLNFRFVGDNISLTEKANFYIQLAYSKFVTAGLIEKN